MKLRYMIIQAHIIEYAFQIQNILQTGMGQLRVHFLQNNQSINYKSIKGILQYTGYFP